MATKEREILSAGAGLAAEVALESGPGLGEEISGVRARGYWEQVWRRLKKDKIALASGIFIFLLFALAFAGAPLARAWLGHGPNDIFPSSGVDSSLVPVGPLTSVHDFSTNKEVFFLLGASDTLGRDEFLRLLYGARVSLQVAFGATFLSMFIGVLLGAIAGYYRGWIDAIISRITEIVMAFPLLLFVIALAATAGQRLNDITVFGIFPPGVLTLIMVGGIFSWFYPARIIRAQVLSLREKEFIEAARMTGAGDWRIIRSHLLPHLVAPIIVYSTLIVAQFVLFEAGLSFLGLGVKLPTASWGNLLSTAPEFYTQQPWLMVWPGLAVLLTTLAFNLLGDGLRDAFDPRASAH